MYQQTLPDGSTRTTGWICTRCMSSLWPTVASESDPEKLKAAVTLLMSGLINVGHRPAVESVRAKMLLLGICVKAGKMRISGTSIRRALAC
jgi:hypothetical protein